MKRGRVSPRRAQRGVQFCRMDAAGFDGLHEAPETLSFEDDFDDSLGQAFIMSIQSEAKSVRCRNRLSWLEGDGMGTPSTGFCDG
ncbi:hypothetical protein Pla52n_50990 [Stieleria varia]|uniref:Uncharacterized protein n=1 Tax=Stieleria varia TaxID=2528005 RepID=A0A5C6AK96_9BACT|nr:hypothetical protein Pla52n_50990 [Stieleria varia]